MDGPAGVDGVLAANLPTAGQMAGLADTVALLLGEVRALRLDLAARPAPAAIPEGVAAGALARPVDRIGLHVRARKACWRAGVRTVAHLCSLTADELLEWKNFGQGSLADVVEALDRLGLCLADGRRAEAAA
jgi:DNA-directed RNA polymerase alpha subunit